MRRGVEYGELAVEVLVELEYGGHVAAAVAVVGRRPDGQHGLVEVPLVALHDELVGATNEVDVVGVVELSDHVAAEQVAGAARTHAPADDLLRVGPKQIANGALVRHLLLAVDGAYLIESGDGGREAAVHAEDLLVDDGRQADVVEDLRAVLPHANRAVLAQALVVEAVHLGDLTRLVVAAYERDAVRIAHLEREQEQKGLDAVEAAVDKVAQEQVVGLGHVASDPEELLQIVELAVYVAAYGDGRVHLLHVALLGEYLARLRAQRLHLALLDDLALLQLLDLAVQIALLAHCCVCARLLAGSRLALCAVWVCVASRMLCAHQRV